MILVVEDDPACAEHTCEVLRLSGYKPTLVTTLADAMANARIEYEAIFLDLLLPDTSPATIPSGVASVRTAFPNTPLIVLSGYLPEFKVIDLLRAGADFCLHKPLDRSTVGSIVKRAIEINSGDMSGICARLERACARA